NNASQGAYVESGAISTMTAVEFSRNGAQGLYVGGAQAYIYGSTFASNGSYGAEAGDGTGTLQITTAVFTNNGSGVIRMHTQSNFQLTGAVTATASPVPRALHNARPISLARTWRP